MSADERFRITQATADILREQGWTDETIREKYVVDDEQVEAERKAREKRVRDNRAAFSKGVTGNWPRRKR